MRNFIYTMSLLLAFSVVTGCGESDSTDKKGEPPLAVDYDYTAGGSNVRLLAGDAVNNHTTRQEKLSALIDAQDYTTFHNIFEYYIIELLDTPSSDESNLSSAPRGDSKSLLIDVVNGEIDYTGFILKGDINFDSKIDFDDIEALKAALFAERSTDEYDVDSDGIVDIRDMIFLLARIGTEVSFFDFYTPTGEKIVAIPTRAVSDPQTVAYTGTETQVMVVPKDVNKASGFTSGLSDSDDAWYKQTGWVYQDDDFVRSAFTDYTGASIEEAIKYEKDVMFMAFGVQYKFK